MKYNNKKLGAIMIIPFTWMGMENVLLKDANVKNLKLRVQTIYFQVH